MPALRRAALSPGSRCPPAGAEAEASIGLPLASANGDGPAERVIERCENCGCALERGVEPDLAREWAALERGGEVRSPNRASLQAWIGVEGWVVTAGGARPACC